MVLEKCWSSGYLVQDSYLCGVDDRLLFLELKNRFAQRSSEVWGLVTNLVHHQILSGLLVRGRFEYANTNKHAPH